jgi:hypothetical protein
MRRYRTRACHLDAAPPGSYRLTAVHFSKLNRGELVAMVGGALLLVCVFVPAFKADPSNPNATLAAGAQGHCGASHACSVFQIFSITRVLLIAAAAAPFFLAYIIARDHELSWPRGQVTMIVAIAAIGLLFYHGVIDRPGTPSGAISLKLGWVGALLGALLMLTGSLMRQSETEMVRKPPGVL